VGCAAYFFFFLHLLAAGWEGVAAAALADATAARLPSPFIVL
jgi:hypothetical protein